VSTVADKPILITRFTKNSEELGNATYYDVRTGKTCRITTGESKDKNVIPVRSYRSVLNAYVNNGESKFNGPDGKQCWIWTRGVLQRMHIIAGEHRYCGKEFKRKLEQGPVDHENDFTCKMYENGKVEASAELLKRINKLSLSERDIARRTGLHRKPVHLFCSGKPVRRKTAQQIINLINSLAATVRENSIRQSNAKQKKSANAI
jgi:hypothetical protein